MIKPKYYPRRIQRKIERALEYAPVVLIQGPRQCGKTTLAKIFLDSDDNAESKNINSQLKADCYVSFDDRVEREKAESDSVAFLSSLPQRVIFDEIQLAPEILDAIKMEVDRSQIPGQFILTGSCDVLQLDKIPDSLAGRMHIIRLHPLAQCEIDKTKPDLIDSLLNGKIQVGRYKQFEAPYMDRLMAGGYPRVLKLSNEHQRMKWCEDYTDSMIERDLMEFTHFQRIKNLPELIRTAAENTAQLLNISSMAANLEDSRPTVMKYLALLEKVFLLEQLPAWHTNRTKRTEKTQKLHMLDTGLVAAMLELDRHSIERDRSEIGKLLETFVLQELRRSASWRDKKLTFSHFRDRDGVEVDIVIERGRYCVAGVEVKAAKSVDHRDFSGLRKLKKLAGDRFATGIVLYDGPTCRPFGDKLFAVPLRSLWEPLPRNL